MPCWRVWEAWSCSWLPRSARPAPSDSLVNPIPDTVDSVDAGAALYQANCARCHGVDGLGGGPDAGTTQFPPANLRSGHLLQHSDADIYTWITDGIQGGMPAWSGTLTETDRWNLVNYLRAIDGRGPSPAPSAASAPAADGPPAAAGIGFAGVVGLALLGWLGVGLRRGSTARRSAPGPSPGATRAAGSLDPAVRPDRQRHEDDEDEPRSRTAAAGSCRGSPSRSASVRQALTVTVTGLISAIGWSQSGNVATGTNALDTNVSGKIQMNPAAWTDSVSLTTRPMSAEIQLKA